MNFLDELREKVIEAMLNKARDERADPADVITKQAGIFCPHQDPGVELWCQVYRNWEDYQAWGEGGHAEFCRKHCQHGRNPEVARRNREIVDRRRGKYPGWLKAMGSPPEFMFPKRGRRLP